MTRSLRRLVAGVALAVAATAAHADVKPTEVRGVNNGFVGGVRYDRALAQGSVSYEVMARCDFASTLTPNNTLVVTFAGFVLAAATDQAPVWPDYLWIRCTIRQGALSTSAEQGLGGPLSATAGSNLLDTSGPREWPVAPVTICTEARAFWASHSPVIVYVWESCRTPT